MDSKVNELIFENSNGSDDILEQFLSSDCRTDNQINMDKFLDEDKTIDVEKLELAIILMIDYLENSIKNSEPIYINLGGMHEYVRARNLGNNIERIMEESSFILGFCQSVANENKLDRDIIVRFRGIDE